MNHLKDLDPILEEIRKVSQTVTATELDFLRIYEELLVYLIKKPGLDIFLKSKVFDVLEGINKQQQSVLKDMSSDKKKMELYYVNKTTAE